MFNAMQKFAGLNGAVRQMANQQFRIINQRFFGETQTQKVEKGINKVQLLGRVGNAPQRRGTEDRPVVSFSLATSSNYKNANGDVLQRTEWHRVVVFNQTFGENIANVVTKGSRLLVNGRISYNEIKDRDGNTKTVTNIIADDIIYLQIKPSDSSQQNDEDED